MSLSWAMIGHHWLNATFTGVYQGLALAAVVWLLLKCLPRTNAATRHAIRWAALLAIAALPVVHWITAVASFERPEPNASREASLQIAASPSTPPMPVTPLTFELPHEPIVVSSEGSFKETSTSPRKKESRSSVEPPLTPRPAPTFLGESYSEWSPADPPGRPRPARHLSLPRGTGLLLMTVWISLAFIRLLFLARQSRALAKMSKNGRAPAEEWRRQFESLRDEMGLKRRIRLRMVPTLNGPIVMGCWRPAILFPAELPDRLATIDWERIMRHELAHVARFDHWTNAWEQMIAAVWFFHPAVWWLKRDLALDREIACDDHVLATPSSARRYALLLAQFASQTHKRKWTAAPAAWNHRSQLKQRIDMLLDPTRNACPRLSITRAGTLLLALGLAAGGAFQFTPRLAFSQHSPSADDLLAPPQKRPVTKVEVNKKTLSSQDAVRNESILSSTDQSNHDDLYIIKTPSAVITTPRPDARPSSHCTVIAVPTQAANQPAGSLTISSSRDARPRLFGAASLAALPDPPAPPAPAAPPAPPAPTPQVSAQAPVDYHRPKSAASEWPVAEAREESLERRMEKLERMVERMLKMKTPPARADDSLGHVEGGSRSESEAHTNLLRKEQRHSNPIDSETSSYEEEKDKSSKLIFKEAEKQFRAAQKELDGAIQHEDLARLQRRHVFEQVNHLAMERQILEEQRRSLRRELEILEKRIAEIAAQSSVEQAGEDGTDLRRERQTDSEPPPSY